MSIWATGGESVYGDTPAAPTKKPFAGGAVGAINYEENRDALTRLYQQRKDTNGPAALVAQKAGYTAPSGAGQAQQAQAAGMLDAASQGKGPSAAPTIMRQGTDEAIRARLAAVAGAPRSGSAALTGAAAGGIAANVLSQAAGNAAQTKASEVQSATGQYAGLTGAMRGQDQATAAERNRVLLANATMEQQASMQNQQAAIQWEQMSDAERNAILGMRQGIDQNHANNMLNYYRDMWGQQAQQNAIDMRSRQEQDSRMAGLIQGTGAAVMYGAKAYGASKGSGGWTDADTDALRRA